MKLREDTITRYFLRLEASHRFQGLKLAGFSAEAGWESPTLLSIVLVGGGNGSEEAATEGGEESIESFGDVLYLRCL